MTHILQILPRVPPAICGIGDYSLRLARELHAHHNIHSSFLGAGTDAIMPEGELEYPTTKLPSLTAGALVHHLRERTSQYDAIVLQVSLYGYQKRAVPFWLSRAMTSISQMPDAPPIVTMFHELYASGSMKSSAFWLQPLQKMILRGLVRSANALRTNREDYADWINQVSGRKTETTAVMPVFSNFGELANPPKLEDRPASMVIFLSGIQGNITVLEFIQKAVSLCKKFNLHTLHLVGGNKPDIEMRDGVHLRHKPFVSIEESTMFFSNCRMAYTGYNPSYLAKSGIFAAFATHGLAVITRGDQSILPDGLQEQREVLYERGLENERVPELSELQKIADNLRAWYEHHNLARTAASYANDIERIIK